MLLLLTILLIGGFLGVGLGGDLRNLAEVRLRGWWLIPGALVLQLLPIPHGGSGFGELIPVVILLLSYLGLIVAAIVNLRLKGFVLILLGLVLNFTVIAANRGMPVDQLAVKRSGNPELFQGLPREPGGKHHLAAEGDILLPLADVIAVRQPFGIVVSAGDVLIDTGGAMFLAAAILGRPRRPRRRPSRPQPAAQAEMWGTRPSRWSPDPARSRS